MFASGINGSGKDCVCADLVLVIVVAVVCG